MTSDEHNLIFELAKTTPFPYKTLLGSYLTFRELTKNKNVTTEVKMEGFKSTLELSQAMSIPLPQVIAMVGKVLRKRPSWFKRILIWFGFLLGVFIGWVKRKLK